MDKTRLVEAKRRNGILQICKEWRNNGIEIAIDDFYDIHTTLQLQEKIIAKLDDLDTQKKYIVCKKTYEIEDFLNYTSIFICSCGLENGVCLWRGEYDSRVYCW